MTTGTNPAVGLAIPDVDLADMNGDALPDLIHTGDVHEVFFNNDGREWKEPYNVPGGFTEIKLSQTNTMLMDMNGDGFTDLFSQYPSINGYRYFPGGQSNNGWNLTPTEMANSPNFTFGDITKPVDLDNDGRTDIIRKVEFASEITCVFNINGQIMSGEFIIDAPSTRAEFNFGPDASSGLRLADMNGDGLQDFVILNGEGYIWYYPGHGVTIDSATPWHYQGWDSTPRGAWPQGDTSAEGYRMADAPDSFDDPDFTEVTNFRSLRLLDINGDGLSDLVYVSNNRLLAWLNFGGHAFSQDPYVIPAVSDTIPDQSPETNVRLVDMNANGTTDVVWNRQTGFTEVGHPEATWVYLDLTKGVRPNLLKEIDNGIGKVTTIEYKSSTDYLVADRAEGREWVFKVPFPVNVVARIEVFDGRSSTYVRTMTYHDGYYDGEEKEFRGFAAAEQRDVGDATAPDLVMAYAYDTGQEYEALKGKPLEIKAQTLNDETFYNEQYTWATRTLAEGVNGDERKVTFPFQEMKIRDVLEKGSGSPVQLKWEYEYDNYGNMTRRVEHGRMDPGWDDERVTETTFTAGYDSGLNLWILDKQVEQTIKDETGKAASVKRSYYDGSQGLGTVTKGNLTRVEDWVGGEEFVISVRNDYDEFGNIIAIYDPLYPSEPGHYRTITYDETFHTFPVAEHIYTGSLLLTMSALYDHGFGVMTSSTDFNGHTTTYGYDTFARLTSITKPPDTGHTLEYEYVLSHDFPNGKVINWVETRQRDGSLGDGFLGSRTFFDGLGRQIMTRSEGEDSGQIVVTDTVQFNSRKLPWKKYLPYFDNGSLAFQEPTFNSGFTEHFYDALAREVLVNQPVGPEGIVFSTTTYRPLERVVKDEEQTRSGSANHGNGMRYVEDGLFDNDGNGRLREVYEIVKISDVGEPLSAPVEWKTSYSYNILDNLTGYIDSQNNQKIIQYDGLQRKTFMNDPDRGHMHYTYDTASNLIKTVDAKSQVIEYGYDGVNRLKAEYYGLGKVTPDVEYHYDVSYGPVEMGYLWQQPKSDFISDAILHDDEYDSDHDINSDNNVDVADVVKAKRENVQSISISAENTLGFLSWVRDQSGEEHNSYDSRGRVKWVIKRIMDTGSDDLRNFYTSTRYDSMDRVTRLTYPDSTYVDYQYNSRGLLESIPNVIERYDYNPAGQNALLALACETVTTYDYDHRLRLSRLHTIRTRDNLALQDLNYTYDGVSNITAILDGRTNAHLDTVGNELGITSAEARQFNATQQFVYDSLYRLTRATNTNVYGSIDYRYDRIGNMVLKNADLHNPDPLMHLGTMKSGGTSGTFDRTGRSPGDQPGPHAITATQNGHGGPMSFVYDDNGNMVTEGELTLTWDFKDRLAVLVNEAKIASYLYDYKDARRKKTVVDSGEGSSTEIFYIDKSAEIRGNKLLKYVYAGDNKVARSDNFSPGLKYQATNFYLNDHLGSTHYSVTNASVINDHIVNYPFGYQRTAQIPLNRETAVDYGFAQKELDKESDLYYFEARYYSPVIGKFISVDQLYGNDLLAKTSTKNPFFNLRNSQNLNLYTYVQGNPMKFIDDSGESPALPYLISVAVGVKIGFKLDGVVNKIRSIKKSIVSKIKNTDTVKYMLKGIVAKGKIDGRTTSSLVKGAAAGAAAGLFGLEKTKRTIDSIVKPKSKSSKSPKVEREIPDQESLPNNEQEHGIEGVYSKREMIIGIGTQMTGARQRDIYENSSEMRQLTNDLDQIQE